MGNAGQVILNITAILATMWINKKFLGTFFEKKPRNLLGNISWIAFFCFQVWAEMNKGNASLWNTVISVVLVFIISITNYRRGGKIKFFYIVILYVTWSIVEMAVFFFMDLMPVCTYNSVIIGSFISKIMMMIMIIVLSEYWGKKNRESVTTEYYLVLLFVPVGSIYIADNSYRNSGNTFSSMITFSILILINIIIFEIYSRVSQNFILEREKAVYAQQINIITRSTGEQKKIMEEFHEEKHNLINQLIALKNSVEQCENNNVIENLNRIIKNFNIEEHVSTSGNKTVDAIINFKYLTAKENRIELKLKIFIPEFLPVNQCDLGLVLGNALDNAIEATKVCRRHDKIIQLSMGVKKESLVIVIVNPYEHDIITDKTGKLISTKEDSSRHGYGVNSIRKVVEQHQGELIIDTENHYFTLTAILNIDMDIPGNFDSAPGNYDSFGK